MSTLKALFGPSVPGTTDATRYTAPAAGAILTELWLTNTTGSDATYNLGFNATAATAGNCLMYNFTVPAGKTVKLKTKVFLTNGQTLHDLQGTASAITVTGFGVDLT